MNGLRIDVQSLLFRKRNRISHFTHMASPDKKKIIGLLKKNLHPEQLFLLSGDHANNKHTRDEPTTLTYLQGLRSSYTMRTKCAISDAFVRDCVFTYCASVAQYVYSLSAEHCFRLRNNAMSIRLRNVLDCALSTHSVFRPLHVFYFCQHRVKTSYIGK